MGHIHGGNIPISATETERAMEATTNKGRSFDHRHIGVGIVLLSLMIPFSYYPSGFSLIIEGWIFTFPVSQITQYIWTDFQYASFFLYDFLMLLTPHVFLGTSIFAAHSLYNRRSTRMAGIIHAVYFGFVILFSFVALDSSSNRFAFSDFFGFSFFLGGLAGLTFLIPSSASHDEQTTDRQPSEPIKPSTIILPIGMIALIIWGFGIISEGLDSNISPIYIMPFLFLVGGPIILALPVIAWILDLLFSRLKPQKEEESSLQEATSKSSLIEDDTA